MTSEPGKEQERHLITNLMALEKSKERVREHMIYTSTIKRKALLNGPSTPHSDLLVDLECNRRFFDLETVDEEPPRGN